MAMEALNLQSGSYFALSINISSGKFCSTERSPTSPNQSVFHTVNAINELFRFVVATHTFKKLLTRDVCWTTLFDTVCTDFDKKLT